MPIITRFSKGEIFRFSGLFFRVEETERITQKFDNGGEVFPYGAVSYEIEGLTPTKGRIVHIDKIGINGFVQVQLVFPERTPRGAVKGAQYLNFRIACHQNPHDFTFFVPENVEVFLDILNAVGFPILSEILFKGWLYVITPLGKERPRDPITKELLPFKDITNYTPFRS